MQKKLFSLLLAALLLASATACSGKTENQTTADTSNATETVAGDGSSSETTAETDEEDFVSNLPKADYGGREFRIEAGNSLAGITSSTTINIAEELTGEVVNDALYNRDRYLEQQYNITIKNTLQDVRDATVLNKLVLSGDAGLEVSFGDIASYGGYLMLTGTVYPMNMVENVNLDKPYWNQAANEAMTIGTSVYFPTGAISPRFYGSVYIILFNKDIAEDMGIENLYDTVQEGTWTMDKMFNLAKGALVDLNGDGEYGAEDQYGLTYEVLTANALWVGADKNVVKTVDGELQYTIENESVVNLFERILKYYEDPSVIWGDDAKYDGGTLLNEGRTLFQNPCTFNLTEYREVDFDFGILPMPKENENQANYVSYGQPWVTYCPYVPITITGADREMVGMVIDAMAAYGHQYIRPAVFDNVIQLKSTRDEESAKIVHDIFDNVSFELVSTVSSGNVRNMLDNLFTYKYGTMEFTSSWAKIKDAATKELDSLISTIAENEAKMQ